MVRARKATAGSVRVIKGISKGKIAALSIQDWCRRNGFTVPKPEYKFHPTRRWKFDLAWPADMVAIEIQGGAFVGGGHTRGPKFEKDCEKFSIAASLGWRILLCTHRQVESGKLFKWIDATFPP